jgi:hypothetical protein
MADKKALKLVADAAADSLDELRSGVHGLRAFLTPLSAITSTNTNGYSVDCGALTMGHRPFYFELFHDEFVRFSTDKSDSSPHFWYGVSCASHEALRSLAEYLPKYLQPIRTFTAKDQVDDAVRIRATMPSSASGRVVMEREPGKAYLGVYNSYSGTTKTKLRRLGAEAYEFWERVIRAAHDQSQVDEDVLEGVAAYQTTLARKRSATLRAHAIKHFRPLRCAACGFSTPMSELKNREVIEFHHKKPVSWMDVSGSSQPLKKALASLVPLCPTCHRISHSHPSGPRALFSVSEVRKIRRGANPR